jgi:hypothetical protein
VYRQGNARLKKEVRNLVRKFNLPNYMRAILLSLLERNQQVNAELAKLQKQAS